MCTLSKVYLQNVIRFTKVVITIWLLRWHSKIGEEDDFPSA